MMPTDGAMGSRLRRLAGSLKVRITAAGIIVLALSIGLVTYVVTTRTEKAMLNVARQHEMSEAARAAARLSRQVVELQQALRVVSLQLDRATLDDRASLTRFLEGKPVLSRLFTSVFAASADGALRIFADSDGITYPTLDLSQRAYFQRTLKENRPSIGPPLDGKLSGAPVVVFTQPVRDGNGVYAVFGGALRLSQRDLLDSLVDATDEDVPTMVVVTDGRGQILAHWQPERVMQSLADEPRLAHAFEAWRAQGSPAEPTGVLLEQAGEVASAAGVAGPGWIIWRARAEADLLAPLRDASRFAMTVSLALVALLSALLLGFLWAVLRPLTLLEQRAEHLFDNNMRPETGWPAATGEIRSLSIVLRRVGIERLRLEQKNVEMMGKLGSVMSAAPTGLAFAQATHFELVSAEFCRLFAGTQALILASPPGDRFASENDHRSFLDQEKAAFQIGEACAGEWQMRRCDGTLFWAWLRSNPVDADNVASGTIWSLGDIDDQRAERELLEWTASHDSLTGLANRSAFGDRAARLVAAKPRPLPAAMVFIDLDEFKPVNDTAGHLTGDLMLLTVAKAITGRVRAGDLVARIGGDEFAILLEQCPLEVAMGIAEAVRQAVAEVQLPWAGNMLRVGASVGVAALTAQTASVDMWLEAADAACYAAKASGRNAVRASTTDGDSSART